MPEPRQWSGYSLTRLQIFDGIGGRKSYRGVVQGDGAAGCPAEPFASSFAFA